MDKEHLSQRIGSALYIGGLLGLIAGIGRVFLFFYFDNYTASEIQTFALNYFHYNINLFVSWGLAAGLLLFAIGLLFKRIEGFILSGFLVLIPMLPAAYGLNKLVLPGRTHPISLAGNGLIALVALGLTYWIFKKWLSNTEFSRHLYRKGLLLAILTIVILSNLLYFAQPDEKKLKSAPSSPDGLAEFMEIDVRCPEINNDCLQSHFSVDIQKHLSQLPEKIALRDTASIIEAADRVLNREFEFLNVAKTLPAEIDWQTNPTADREWLLSLNRMDWLWELSVAYKLTHDEKYATAFDEIMRSWLAQNKFPGWKNERNYVWRLIETGVRITDSWLEAFAIFISSDAVGADVKLGMLASFHDHAQFLAHFRSPRRNHLLQETSGLLAVACAFPEFKMSEKWLKIAKDRLDFAIKSDVYSDGGYNEGSTYYHRFAIRILQQIADFANAYEVQLTGYFYQQLERMYTFLMNTSRPDGVMSAMNDGFHAKNLRILYEKPAQMFDRADFAFYASEGERGQAPEETSVYYPNSGIGIMRSDWSEQARFAIFDGSTFGSSHGHEDKLNFELFAFGKPFIVESGTFTYVINRWRKYFASSFSHNTIVVDDKSQLRYRLQDKWVNQPESKLGNCWISNTGVDYIESVYSDGYGNIKEDVLEGVTHTRRLIFVKPDYWILWDVVEGNGKHKIEQRFHFAEDLLVTLAEEGLVNASYDGGPALMLKTLSPEGCEITLAKGEKEPIRGWVSSTYGTKQPAFMTSLVSEEALPVAFVQVIFPVKSKASFSADLVAVQNGDEQLSETQSIALSVATESWRDTIMLSPGVSGEKVFGDNTSASQLWLNRRTRSGVSDTTQVAVLERNL